MSYHHRKQTRNYYTPTAILQVLFGIFVSFWLVITPFSNTNHPVYTLPSQEALLATSSDNFDTNDYQNFPGNYAIQNLPASTVCDPQIITSNLDDGTCGTLRYGLAYLTSNPAAPIKIITLTLSTPVTITLLNTGLTVPAGVTINGLCGPNGPGLTIYGNNLQADGLTINGGGTLINGVRIGGFKGKQVKVNAPGNSFKCFSSRVNLSVVVGQPASIVAYSGTPQSIETGKAFSPALKSLVKDAANNPVSGSTVTFSAPATGAGGSFEGGVLSATVSTDAAGIATAPVFTANSVVGSFSVTAMVNGIATPALFNLTVLQVSQASITATTGSDQTAIVGSQFNIPLQATVKNSAGDPLNNVPVTFQTAADDITHLPAGTFAGSIISATVTTNAAGIATAPVLKANGTSGSYLITAKSSGIAESAVFSLTNLSGAPTTMTLLLGTSQTASVNNRFTSPLQVIIKDAGGNPVSNINVTFQAPNSGAGGKFNNGSNAITVATDSNGIASTSFVANGIAGSYSISAKSDAVSNTVTFNLTNDTLIVPPIANGKPTTIIDSTSFLYTGSNPIQTGVVSGTIQDSRASVLRGKVFSRDGLPLFGVKVSILGHPEFGQTQTRAGGLFDLAVNGGSDLILQYEKPGFLEVQRTFNAPSQDYGLLPDVMLIGADNQSTTVNLSTLTDIAVVRGSLISDTRGERRGTLFFSPGTSATMKLPGGSTQPLGIMTVRITEYSVGEDGRKAMPGTLPPSAGYSYATEYTVDEAVAAGATEVDFDQPVWSYVENFLNIPVGTIAPAGYYDRISGAWIPSDNGHVIKVLSITNGMADLDLTGGGTPASLDQLTLLGITNPERSKLAALYSPGESLYRVPLKHFSAWDT